MLTNLDNDFWSEDDNDDESEPSFRGTLGKPPVEKDAAGEEGSKDITRIEKSADASRLMPERINEVSISRESERSQKKSNESEKPIQKKDEYADELFGPNTK